MAHRPIGAQKSGQAAVSLEIIAPSCVACLALRYCHLPEPAYSTLRRTGCSPLCSSERARQPRRMQPIWGLLV